MNIPRWVRQLVYIVALVLAVILAIGVVWTDWITGEEVVLAMETAGVIFAGLAGLLALINLSPE
jgi:hypothetical protein